MGTHITFHRRQLTDSELRRQLNALEAKHEMTSDEFLAQYNAGTLGDEQDFVRWAGLITVAKRVELDDRAPA